MTTLLVDGYNVIHALPQLQRVLAVSLSEARIMLLDMIVRWRCSRGGNDDVIVVFDSNAGEHVEGTVEGGIRCVYTTAKNDADSFIVDYMRTHQGKCACAVVSNDSFLINHCKVFQCTCLNPSTITGAEKKKRNSLARGGSEHKAALPPGVRDDINRFLRSQWKIS